MPRLFEPTTLDGMTLRNRFVRSAMWEGMAHDDGASTTPLDAMMADLAAAGVRLIISSCAYVRAERAPRVHVRAFLSKA